ncbi:hypothetical protein PWT90_00596 [Aphanocladium album]|nr:hypothetical protein PWT90_00596 [Aphanocladium album]
MEPNNTKPEGYVFDRDLAEKLADLEDPRGIRFSPDGKKIVYALGRHHNVRKGKNFVSSLWLASTADAGSARQLTSGTSADSSPQWHPDGNRILFQSDRSEPGKKQGVWVLRLDGGDPTAITPVDDEQGIECWQLSPDGRTLAYASADEETEEEKKKKDDDPDPDVWGKKWEYARLRLIDLETKESKVIVGGDRHITSLHWSSNGKRIAFRSESNTESEERVITGSKFSVVNVESGVIRDLCTCNIVATDLKWAHDGKIYFICIMPAGKNCGSLSVAAIDPAEESPSVTRAAYGEQDDALGVVISGGKVLVKRVARFTAIVSELGGDDLFTLPDTEIHSWDVFFDNETGKPSLATSTSSLNAPEEAVIFTDGGKSKSQLSYHGKVFKDRAFGKYKILNCQSTDGEVDIDAIYLTPAAHADADGKPTKPLPTMVMIHGGPSDSNGVDFNSSDYFWSTYAIAQGYGVLLPQYRGSFGRGEAFGAYSTKGVGKYDYEDVIALTDYAVKQGFADGARLLVGGWSQGGYLSYLASVRNGLHGLGWRFKAAVAGGGVTDWDSLCYTSVAGAGFQTELAGGTAPWSAERGDTTGRQGSALWEMAHAVAESKRLGDMVIPPMLILHGANDVQCATSQAEGFRRGLRAHGLECEYVKYPGEGHPILRRKFVLDVMERWMRLAFANIGPGETVPQQVEEGQ